MSVKPIILCGGSGTRLWPASRKSLPKQFLPLFGNKTLLDLTIERIKLVKQIKKPILVSSKDHSFIVNNALKKNDLRASLILEPVAKNTTAAIYLGAQNSHPNDVLVIMSSDAYISDNHYFAHKINDISNKIDHSNWLIFGVKPKYPAEQYGYINVNLKDTGKLQNVYKVINFIEKPSKKNAEIMIKNKSIFWNSGIFMGRASMIINSIQKHAPKIAQECDKAYQTQNYNPLNDEINFNKDAFNKIPSESIDYSTMENADNVLFSPLECEWDDVGSWDALSKISNLKNDKKNVFEIATKNTFIKNDKRVIAAIGVEDLIIIDDDNATLIAKRGHTEKVKDIVNKLHLDKMEEASEHTYENRPWGKFINILSTEYCKVKKIEVLPKKRLSLQYHNFRSEHWLVVKGQAHVYIDGVIKTINSGNSIDIPMKSQHYVENKTDQILIIIETQLGTYFGEDDIVRLDDPYNR